MAALEERDFLEKSKVIINQEKNRLMKEIKSIQGLKVIDSNANFFMVDISGTGMTPKNLKWRLLAYGVLVKDLSSSKGLPPRYIRVSVRRPEENAILMRALRNILNSMHMVFPYALRCEAPCHFRGQDCRLCYCPFYPCLDEITGGEFVESEWGGFVWSCEDCLWIHKRSVADFVIAALHNVNVYQLSPRRLLAIRKAALRVNPP